MAYTTINKSTDYFNTITYSGNASTQSITGVGFQPDLNWTKGRNVGTFHMLTDAVRGATKVLQSNTTTAEQTFASGLTSFNSDGFTAGNSDDINGNYNYASWNWKANGTGSSNTDGSITSTVSVNTTAGFSIVKWTETSANSQTIGHGLGITPSMIITKLTDDSNLDWYTYHQSLGKDKRISLNSTGGSTSSGFFNGTLNSSVFHVGYGDSYDNKTAIAYCFAEKKGYSKFGSYTGNGNADGTFVYTGFKPAFVLWKHTTDSYGWYMLDNKRDPDNVAEKYIYANLSDAEGTNPFFDLLSNGFKVRESGGGSNGSGATYIYMAFAEAPLVGTNNVPCTAR